MKPNAKTIILASTAIVLTLGVYQVVRHSSSPAPGARDAGPPRPIPDMAPGGLAAHSGTTIFPPTASRSLSDEIPFSTRAAEDPSDSQIAARLRDLRSATHPDDAELIAGELAATGSAEAVAGLLKIIRQTTNDLFRQRMSRAFQRLDNPAATPAVIDDGLLEFMDDYSTLAALRECAPRILDTNGLDGVVNALLRPDLTDWQRSNLLGYLSEVRKPACADLLAEVVRGVTNLVVKEEAIVSLAKIGNEKSLSYLLEFLGDPDLRDSHEHVLYMIGRIQNRESIRDLANAFLTSTNEELRYAAARALAIIRQTTGAP